MTAATSCPKPAEITKEIQAQAAKELADLTPGSALGLLLSKSLDDRDKLRACRRIH